MTSEDWIVHDSCGNVFADMGMRDAETRLAKAEVARSIRKILEKRGLKDVEVAELLEITRQDVSDLVRGKLARFGREQLERFLNALETGVRI